MREEFDFKPVKALIRYAFCVFVSFTSAAWALAGSIIAGRTLGLRLGENGYFLQYYSSYNTTTYWAILMPVALSLTVCVVAWRFRKEPK